MSKYSYSQGYRSRRRRLGRFLASVVFILLLIGGGLHELYNRNLGPVSKDQSTKIVTIAPGSSVKQISQQLASEHLIRSAWVLQVYAHGKNTAGKFQAGSYALSPSSSTPQIIDTLTTGRVATRLVTILPGRRIDQVRADLINDGFSPTSVDAALDPNQYLSSPTLGLKPSGVSTLEGLLWPDSYQKDVATDPSFIIRQALDATAKHVTPAIQSAFTAHGLTMPYQGIILASIVEQEVSKPADRAQAAQVFLSRMKAGMMLGSDVTARYGAIAAGRTPSLSYDSAYNTLLHPGLPPTPISSISEGSLQAAANPADTDWLYFVAGDDGITYFSKTLAEHQALTDKHCHRLCGR